MLPERYGSPSRCQRNGPGLAWRHSGSFVIINAMNTDELNQFIRQLNSADPGQSNSKETESASVEWVRGEESSLGSAVELEPASLSESEEGSARLKAYLSEVARR